MNRKNRYTDLIQEAVDALCEAARLNIVPRLNTLADIENNFDAELDLQWENRHQTYWVQVKPTINEGTIGRLAEDFRRIQKQTLLITKAVRPHQAKKLRDLDIQFLDTAGNAYLNNPEIHLFIYGNKRTGIEVVKAKKGILTPAGTKVVFALLCNPELINATYRDVARAANVGLETINRVFKGLQREAYLINLRNRGRKLLNRKQLFDRWVIAYTEQLRPKQLIGIYRPGKEIDWKTLKTPGEGALWGGEIAAAILTKYLKPEIITIYTHRPTQETLIKYKLTKHSEGNVELREIFWNFDQKPAAPAIVPPMLVYTDLIATADPRNVETAKLIYDDYLQRHLGEG